MEKFMVKLEVVNSDIQKNIVKRIIKNRDSEEYDDLVRSLYLIENYNQKSGYKKPLEEIY